MTRAVRGWTRDAAPPECESHMPVFTRKSAAPRLPLAHARPMDTTDRSMCGGELVENQDATRTTSIRSFFSRFQLVKQSKLYITSCANRATFETAE
jgi:hypothetical protein